MAMVDEQHVVLEAQRMRDEGWRMGSIAKRFGVTRETIHRITRPTPRDRKGTPKGFA